jgi:hypothetical protein
MISCVYANDIHWKRRGEINRQNMQRTRRKYIGNVQDLRELCERYGTNASKG